MNRALAILLAVSLLITGCAAPTAPAPATAVPAERPTPAATAPPATALQATPAPTVAALPTTSAPAVSLDAVIAYEMRGSFDFFWEQANTDAGSPGYGLVRDRFPGSPGISSVAAVGFALTAYPIGVEKGYITREQGYERTNGTLDTLAGMERENGFYYHFVDMDTGERAWKSEVSTIDTAILFMGVLTAGEYFGGEIQDKAEQLYGEVNWPWFVDESRDMFYMAYRPEEGFAGHWDFYAEQLMLYVLAAGSPTFPTDDSLYYGFKRHVAAYGDGEPFIHSWFGSLFTYQFSHAWLDFRGTTDRRGVDWFENSVRASRAQYDFAVDTQDEYDSLIPAWGFSACDGPGGYNGLYGAPPSGFDNQAHTVDGTIPPHAAIASLLFLPDEAAQAMLHYYDLAPLQGPYGFQDAYNASKDWYASDVIGIDKGITLLMLANYENDLVYRITMKNEQLLAGLQRLQITLPTQR